MATKKTPLGKYYEPSVHGHIPVCVQPPCQPGMEQIAGFAPENVSSDEAAKMCRIPLDRVLDAKVIRSRKRGNRWSFVID